MKVEFGDHVLSADPRGRNRRTVSQSTRLPPCRSFRIGRGQYGPLRGADGRGPGGAGEVGWRDGGTISAGGAAARRRHCGCDGHRGGRECAGIDGRALEAIPRAPVFAAGSSCEPAARRHQSHRGPRLAYDFTGTERARMNATIAAIARVPRRGTATVRRRDHEPLWRAAVAHARAARLAGHAESRRRPASTRHQTTATLPALGGTCAYSASGRRWPGEGIRDAAVFAACRRSSRLRVARCTDPMYHKVDAATHRSSRPRRAPARPRRSPMWLRAPHPHATLSNGRCAGWWTAAGQVAPSTTAIRAATVALLLVKYGARASFLRHVELRR